MSESPPILFGPLPPPYGGVSVFMSALVPAVAEQGAEIWSYTGETNAIFVNHRQLGHIFRLLTGGFGRRVTDSTHFHLEYPNRVLLPLWIIAKLILRVRWVKIVHDGSLPSRYKGFSSLQRWLFRLAVRSVDEFIVADPALAEWVREAIQPAAEIRSIPTVLPPPVDWGEPELSAGTSEVIESFRRHDKRVCSLGAFIPSYGFADVVTAVEALRRDRGEDIALLLVAGTFALDEEFRRSILAGRDWIHVLENVPHAELPIVYKSSNVFVRAFEHESYGISRVEAMICGTRVIATNAGETRGILIYEFGDTDRLAVLIRQVFDVGASPDIDEAVQQYRVDMERNLAAYLAVVMGEDG